MIISEVKKKNFLFSVDTERYRIEIEESILNLHKIINIKKVVELDDTFYLINILYLIRELVIKKYIIHYLTFY
jgi:type III secretory pathway component EscU